MQTNPAPHQCGAGATAAAPLDMSLYRTATLSPDTLADALRRAREAGLGTDVSASALRDHSPSPPKPAAPAAS